MLFNETITETLAEFINCILFSLINNTDFKETLNTEINFGFLQTAKILDHFGFISVNDFMKPNNNKKIVEETGAFEYHVLKSVLLYKFDDFIGILLRKGNTNDLMKLIVKIMNDDNYYKNKVNDDIKLLYDLPWDKKKTLRMSIIDIDKIKQSGGEINSKYKYIKYKLTIN